MKIVAVFLMFLAGTWAHMCLISPHQRGSMAGINKPGSPDCGLTSGPCGQRPAPPKKATIAFLTGTPQTVTIQKNLDHYNPASPGEITISFRAGRTGNFTLLEKIPDNGEPSLTLYSVNITIPKFTGALINTIQVAYITRNPQAAPVYYQCTDFYIDYP